MKLVTIDNPSNVLYPFSRDWYDNPLIVYHGTSSVYSESIEKNGWQMNGQTYDTEDFQKICKFFEDIGWNGTPKNSGYSILRSYALGGEDDYVNAKPISFSQTYWAARNYSRHVGGESIHGLFLAIEDILNICENKQIQDEHRKSIEGELNNLLDMQNKCKNPETLNYGINRYRKFLENFSADFLDSGKNTATELYKKYEYFKKNHFPIVYVLKVEPEWFEGDMYIGDGFKFKELEIRTKTNIPHSSIIARVDFTNGVDYVTFFSSGPQPVLWEKEEWNKSCIKQKKPNFQI